MQIFNAIFPLFSTKVLGEGKSLSEGVKWPNRLLFCLPPHCKRKPVWPLQAGKDQLTLHTSCVTILTAICSQRSKV